MPDAPGSLESETTQENTKELLSRGAHSRQPSISLQSKMRSSSFRNSSISHGAASPPIAAFKSALPPLSPDDDSIHEVFRKQASRLEELERDNKRLEKQLEDANARRKKSEEQLEDLREASVEVVELKDRLEKAEQQATEINKLVGSASTWPYYHTSILPYNDQLVIV
jgi:DNA repair exonuclease SbcCD ATPase subunit